MLRRRDVNIARKQLFNVILINSLITVMPNMVEKAIRLSLFRQAKGKHLYIFIYSGRKSLAICCEYPPPL